jgi:predicted alpha/beta hydrolase
MIRKILIGLLWFIILYFGACFITGAIAGAIAGAEDPANAAEAGRIAGMNAVLRLRAYFALGSLALVIVGTWKGFLPGARKKSTKSPPLP